mgnify:CR=1 FL=1
MIGFFNAIDDFITNNRQLLVTAAVLYWILIKPFIKLFIEASIATETNLVHLKRVKLELEIEKLKREAKQ